MSLVIYFKNLLSQIAELVRAERDHHPFEDRKGVDSSMTLNSTAEFCRTLGDIPSFSSSDLYADEQMVRILIIIILLI